MFTVHGTGGWVNTQVMIWYIRVLAKALKELRPHHRALLLLDCCPSHHSISVLRAAHRSGVEVILVPSRMTWLLQPLDTHAFAVLKRRLRQADFDTKVRLEKSILSPLERVEMQGEVIRRVLVDTSWSEVMRRVGVTGEPNAWRPALVQMLGSEPVHAAAPSVADLVEILQVSTARANEIHDLLVRRPAVPAAGRAAAVAAGPAGSSS